MSFKRRIGLGYPSILIHRLELDAQRSTLNPGHRFTTTAKQVENVLARLELAGHLQFPVRHRDIAFQQKTLLGLQGN